MDARVTLHELVHQVCLGDDTLCRTATHLSEFRPAEVHYTKVAGLQVVDSGMLTGDVDRQPGKYSAATEVQQRQQAPRNQGQQGWQTEQSACTGLWGARQANPDTP